MSLCEALPEHVRSLHPDREHMRPFARSIDEGSGLIVFRKILHELLASTPGAIGAVFLDHEGETVELLHDRPFEAEDHDIKVMGAYQGIFFMLLRELCDRVEAGRPERFKVEFAAAKVLSWDMKDGYYLVLLVDSHASEGLAWRQLAHCREKIMAEI